MDLYVIETSICTNGVVAECFLYMDALVLPTPAIRHKSEIPMQRRLERKTSIVAVSATVVSCRP